MADQLHLRKLLFVPTVPVEVPQIGKFSAKNWGTAVRIQRLISEPIFGTQTLRQDICLANLGIVDPNNLSIHQY